MAAQDDVNGDAALLVPAGPFYKHSLKFPESLDFWEKIKDHHFRNGGDGNLHLVYEVYTTDQYLADHRPAYSSMSMSPGLYAVNVRSAPDGTPEVPSNFRVECNDTTPLYAPTIDQPRQHTVLESHISAQRQGLSAKSQRWAISLFRLG